MVIRVSDIAVHADTWDQGRMVYCAMKDALGHYDKIVVSFANIDTATSSFVNNAFVPLLSLIGLDQLKQRIVVVDSSRQINEMIKRRLLKQAELAAA